MKERAIHGGREWSERDRGRKGGTEKDAEIGRQCEREREEREREKEILLDQTLTIGVVEREFKA